MRKLGPLALLLVLAVASGCFLDEIDKSMANYKSPGPPPKTAAPAEDANPRTASAGKPGAAAPAGPSWWQTARTLGSEPIDATIAACAIDGRVEFQRRDDCLARGGHPN